MRTGYRVKGPILLMAVIALSVIVPSLCMGFTVTATGVKAPGLSVGDQLQEPLGNSLQALLHEPLHGPLHDLLQDPVRYQLQDSPQDQLRAGLAPGAIIGPRSESGRCAGIDFG